MLIDDLKQYAVESDVFYCTLIGEVFISEMGEDYIVVTDVDNIDNHVKLNCYGAIYLCHNSRNELLLFPTSERRGWQEWVNKRKLNINVGDHVIYNNRLLCKIIDIDETQCTLDDLCIYDDPDCRIVSREDICSKKFVKIDKFNHVILKPFDKVLVRNKMDEEWEISFFSKTLECRQYLCMTGIYDFCIPYNSETNDLLCTTNIEPDFYKK